MAAPRGFFRSLARWLYFFGVVLGELIAAFFATGMLATALYWTVGNLVGVEAWYRVLQAVVAVALSAGTYYLTVEGAVSALTWNFSGVLSFSRRRRLLAALVAAAALGTIVWLGWAWTRQIHHTLEVARVCAADGARMRFSGPLLRARCQGTNGRALAALWLHSLYRVPLLFVAICLLTGLRRSLRDARVRIEPGEGARPPRLDLVHISDLHITAGPGVVTLEGAPSPNDMLPELAASLWSEAAGADAILMTGDITDSGDPREWEVITRAWRRLRKAVRDRIVILPGNHDVNILTDRVWRIEPERKRLRQLRLARMLTAMRVVHGRRARVLRGDALVPAALERPVADQAQRCWDTAFPMVVSTPSLNVVVLDSVAPTMNLLTNAFGRVSPRQLAALEKLGPLLSREKKPVIVCLHHHLRAPTDLPIGGKRLQHLFMCVAAPNAVLAAIARAFGRVPVFHGHRHIARRQDVRGVEIIGAASTTLGGFRRSRHGGVEPVGPGYVHWRNNGDAGLEDRFISLGRITLPVEVE